MKPVRKALILVGSVRPRSNSAGLAKGLGDLLTAKGVDVESMRLIPDNLAGDKWQTLSSAWERADLIVLSFPLYVDSLPSYVIRGLEQLAARFSPQENSGKSFAVICNCGFPEAEQTAIALSICQMFAEQAGLNWLGGLPQSGGEALGGKTPQELGGMMRNTTQAYGLASPALAAGEPLPPAAVTLSSKPILPAWIMRIIGSRRFRQSAKENGVLGQIRKTPYA